MIALIDGDLLLYQCGFQAQTEVQWDADDDDSLCITTDVAVARANYDKAVEHIAEMVGADQIVVTLTDQTKPNFRKGFFPGYKANRPVSSRKPLGYKKLREYVCKAFDVMQHPRLEADDLMGIIATGKVKDYTDTRRVICSIDKDMLTIPGLHFNWWKYKEGTKRVSRAQADMAFYTQALSGDTTDNYPGVPGIGAKRSAKLLAPCLMGVDFDERMAWDIVVCAYANKGLDEAYALSQARCARILRATDYDFKKKEVIPWTPTSSSQ